MTYSSDFQFYVATIYGEAENSNEAVWKTIAHSMNNRIGLGEWASQKDLMGIVRNTRYDANRNGGNGPFKRAMVMFKSNKISPLLQRVINVVEPIFYQEEADFTNGVVSYYSPRAQAELHRKKPSVYTKLKPDFADTPSQFTEVKIPSTQPYDFAWYRMIRSRLFIQLVDQSAQPLSNVSVDIVFADKKPVPALSNLKTNSKGELPPFYVKVDMGARFKVNGKLLTDQTGKEIRVVADGKNYQAVIVYNNGKGGIKAKTETHDQTPVDQPKVTQNTTQSQAIKSASIQSNNQSSDKDENVTFSIKILDNENNLLQGAFSYFVRYKGYEKKHTAINGIENNLNANVGEKIDILISGKDSKQLLSSFTVSKSKVEYLVKLNLHSFKIIFQEEKTKSPLANITLTQTYRNHVKEKTTNSNGEITVKAMPGFSLNYKTKEGKILPKIVVDKNKPIRIIEIGSGDEQGTLDRIENTLSDLIPDSLKQVASSSTQKPQSTQHKDITTKRDQKNEINQQGHPVTRVIDKNDVAFTVITYNKASGNIESGLNYFITYKGKEKIHTSGVNGVGRKAHIGEKGQKIEIFSDNGNSQKALVKSFTIGDETKEVKVYSLKPTSINNEKNYLYPLPIRATADFHTNPRFFGAGRKGGRKHAGIDLYAPVGTSVRAIADGVVIRVYAFYAGTHAVEVRHPNHIIRYGEVRSNSIKVKPGDKVVQGQVLAEVGKLQGIKNSMLHLEMYSNINDTSSLTVKGSEGGIYKRRNDLIDPTPFIEKADF
ncbi:M23 family metallopeptidase [Mannheimia pernigra]|uniref:M23 family metallopeptidase n=1 Tax=Mannheimia pernigra TaxID=111844 RepID=UPI00159F547E|nr:M23 family metallopeptidase [Mannheimia pernigra]QLB44510.1 M23 family metallopeptidase [Mannheimia pernigra]